MRERRFAAALFAITLLVVPAAVGCGLVASAPSAPVTEAMAYTATVNASSADVYVIYAFTTGNHKFGATATESGPVSWSADQGELVMTTTTGGRQLITVRQIIDGRKTYSKISANGLPAALADLPGVAGWSETTWTGASSQDLSGILPSLFFWGLVNPSGMASPSSLLGLLRAQASSVQSLGGEILDGINTTHYRALIPLSRLGVGNAADLQQAEQALGTSLIRVDYWIDSSNLLRQLRLVITAVRDPSATTSSPDEVTIPLGTYPITISVSLRLSHYGTRVHVVPPPSDQIRSRVTCVVSKDGFSCSG